MIQLGDGFCLTLKETCRVFRSLSVGIRTDFATDHFDGNLLLNACIFCKVDFTHATTSEQADNMITTNSQSFKRHFSPLYQQGGNFHEYRDSPILPGKTQEASSSFKTR